jgi:hypothetical protein
MSSRGKVGRYNPFPFRVDAARGDLDNPPTLRARAGTGVAPVGDVGGATGVAPNSRSLKVRFVGPFGASSGAIHPNIIGGHPPQTSSGAIHPKVRLVRVWVKWGSSATILPKSLLHNRKFG